MFKIIFFGTSSFAAKILSYMLEQKLPVVAVVTRPDRPQGRELKLSCPPVKEIVQQMPSPPLLFQPEKASDPAFASILKEFHPDLFVVVAFGEIIKQNLLDLPSRGAINIHASLLPKYRGAAPIQRSLMDGVQETGISIIEMNAQMDAGDILGIEKIVVTKEDDFATLEEKLIRLSCSLLTKVISDIQKNKAQKIPQNHSLATFAPKILPSEEKIVWDRSAKEIFNQIRALSPRPGAWCFVSLRGQRKRLKIKRALIESLSGSPRDTLVFNKEKWVVATGELSLSILEVQLEGKKTMEIREFLKGCGNSSPSILSD